jgi:hypothetical protein
MGIEMTLVKRGKSVPRDGLLDQARAQVELEARFRAPLAERGWTPELTTQLVDNTAIVDSELGAAIEARTASRANARREQGGVTDAKSFKRALVHAFNDLRADGVVSDDVYAAIRGAGTLRRSTTRVSGYLAAVEPHVQAHDAALRPYFKGQSALAELRTIKTELDSAQATQEVDYAALPLDTQRIYEAKGRVLSLIEKLNRIGKLAFDGDATTLALFNKDLILRARKSRGAEAPAEAEASETEA